MNRARWDLVAVAAALVIALSAQNVGTDAVRKNLSTGYATTSNLAFYGIVSAGTFFGSGTGLAGVAGPSLTNGYVRAPEVTNIAQAVGGGGGSDTSNWWAVISIEDPSAFGNPGNPLWTDVVVKCWTNGPVHYGDATPVLAYSTTDPALNGAPAWEDFSTNWYPRAFYCQVHTSHDISWLAEWKHISPTHDSSIEATTAYWDGSDSASNPFRWLVMFKDTRPWFHPASNLSWAVTLQNGANSPSVKARDGETTLNNTVWLKVAPMWVNYDPRPRKAREFWNGGAGEVNFTNQHQQP